MARPFTDGGPTNGLRGSSNATDHTDYAGSGPRIPRRPRIPRPGGTMTWWKRSGNGAKHETAADPSLPLIRLDAVTKIFRGDADEETRALDRLTLDIDRGEYVSVSGPSGCGKSTLLSILALLDAPTSGQYWFDGRRTDQTTPSEKARIRNVDVGLVFQSF